MVYWILLANAARAKLLSMSGTSKPLQVKRKLEHPAGRAHAKDILSDEPGRYSKGGKRGVLSALERRLTPHQVEEQRFARQLADLLKTGLERREYDRLAIFAPAQFLGMLREELDANVSKSLVTSAAKDIVDVDLRELPKHLESLLPVPIPNAGVSSE
jgi:protein required for attachment to host cells